jgi:carboxypeptidase C (cathepsin A)
MFGRLSFILCLLVLSSCNWTNVTDFWSGKLGSNITFEAFTGYEQIDWHYPFGKSGMHYHLYSAHGKSVSTNTTVPIFLWLQGGPGSSSMFGAFTEIGPISIKNGKPTLNDWSWNLLGHLLFLDSPLNVGFSYSDTDRRGAKQVSSTDEATNHIINFLYNFYRKWPQLKANPLYLTGESFAGHYLPNLAKKIAYNNTALGFNLQGVAIGDGWTDPLNQVNYYDSYLWSVGVIGNKFRDTCNWFQTQSVINIYEGNYQLVRIYLYRLPTTLTI